jgi:hypothetical protein
MRNPKMAWLKKYVDKPMLLLITVIWNAVSVFIPSHYNLSPETITLIVTVGNAVITYLATETNSTHEKEKKPT